jgi:hypothetical protein
MWICCEINVNILFQTGTVPSVSGFGTSGAGQTITSLVHVVKSPATAYSLQGALESYVMFLPNRECVPVWQESSSSALPPNVKRLIHSS